MACRLYKKYTTYTDTIGNWCNEYKMETAPEKCEAVLFSNWSGDTATIRRPQLTINNRQICYKEHVKLLGIVLDKGLAFNQHIKKVSVEAKRRINQLKTLSSTEWGCNKRVMRLLYVGYIRSVLEYGSDIWGNLISHSNLMKLEAIQNTGATLISGRVRTNNITSLLLEADLIPLSIRYEVNSIKRLERTHRMPNDNPLFDITSSSIPKQRLMRRNNWRSRPQEMMEKLNLKFDESSEKTMSTLPFAPQDCQEGWENIKLYPELCERLKKDISEENRIKRKEITTRTLDSLGHNELEMWSDASVKNEYGAEAALIFKGGENIPFLTIEAAAGKLASTCKAEMSAIKEGLIAIHRNNLDSSQKNLLICTDSQSTIKALESGPLAKVSNILAELQRHIPCN